jgi:hypothetical protein
MKLVMVNGGHYEIYEGADFIGTFKLYIDRKKPLRFGAKSFFHKYWIFDGSLDIKKRWKSIKELSQQISFDNKPGPFHVLKEGI